MEMGGGILRKRVTGAGSPLWLREEGQIRGNPGNEAEGQK